MEVVQRTTTNPDVSWYLPENSCVHSVLLYASEINEDITRLSRADTAIIRWICSARLADRIPSDELRERSALSNVAEVIRLGRLRWYGIVNV